VNLHPWISRLIGGYPMLCEEWAFNKADGTPVCFYVDASGRRYFATGSWDRNRVLWESPEAVIERQRKTEEQARMFREYKFYGL